MDLNFCDLCNESIPQADLEQGRAVRRNERLICAACEAAMTGGHERPGPSPSVPEIVPVAAVSPPDPRAVPASSPLVAVGLAFSAVALVVAGGAGAYLYTQIQDRSAQLRQDLAQVERAAPEQVRTVSAALVQEIQKREEELAAARTQAEVLSARVLELEKESVLNSARLGRVDKLEERLETLDDLASRVDHQGGVLDELTSRVSSLATARENEAKKPAAPESGAASPRPSQPPAAPAAAAPGGALWQNWLADLKSPNSSTRWQALQSLGGTGDPLVVPHLLPMLKDADIFVRMAAARILGDLGTTEAIPALIDALEDEEASVREAALVSLRGLSGQSIPFDPLARDGDRAKRVKAWRDWWAEASKELLGQPAKKAKG